MIRFEMPIPGWMRPLPLALCVIACQPVTAMREPGGDGGIAAEGEHDAPIDEEGDAETAAAALSSLPRDVYGHPAESEMAALFAMGALRGFPDGTFRPDATLSRSSYAAIVSALADRGRVMGGRRCSRTSFTDVSASYWAAASIRRAAELGFLCGLPDGRFEPTQPVTREQLLVSLVSGLRVTSRSGRGLARFADGATVSGWARAAVTVAIDAGIVDNYALLSRGSADGLLRPLDRASRAETASFLARALRLPLAEPSRSCRGECATATDVCLASTDDPSDSFCVPARALFDQAIMTLSARYGARSDVRIGSTGSVDRLAAGGSVYYAASVSLDRGRIASVLFDSTGRVLSDTDTMGVVRRYPDSSPLAGAWVLRGRVLVTAADGRRITASMVSEALRALPSAARVSLTSETPTVDESGYFALVSTRDFEELEVAEAITRARPALVAEGEMFRIGGAGADAREIARF